jgi:hypothetical protein
METTAIPAVIGEADVSRAASVRRAINKLIAATNTNTLDIAYLLFETKSKNYFTGWGFESFSKYAKSLAIKYTKSYYLVRIIENMNAAGLKREEFEPVGMTKLRMISRLKPEQTYKDTPVSLLIRELTLKAIDMTPEEVQKEVDAIMGLTEDDSMCWLNIKVKLLARENVIKPALALAKKHMGSTEKDADGNYKDPSDGAALEMICANFLADPNFNVEETSQEMTLATTDANSTEALQDEVVDLTDETEE